MIPRDVGREGGEWVWRRIAFGLARCVRAVERPAYPCITINATLVVRYTTTASPESRASLFGAAMPTPPRGDTIGEPRGKWREGGKLAGASPACAASRFA